MMDALTLRDENKLHKASVAFRLERTQAPMMKWIANFSINRRLMEWVARTSINRRLLWASVIVALIPGLVISVLGVIYMQALGVHGQAVQVSTDAVKVATKQLADLEHMNADLNSLHLESFVANSTGNQDKNFSQLEQSLNNEINTLRATCRQTLTRYRQDYQLMTSGNMESVRAWAETSHSPDNDNIEEEQQNTLEAIINQEWPAYIQAQSQELEALKSSQPNAYQLLIAANNTYAALDRDWHRIVALAEKVGDRVVQVDAMHKVSFAVVGAVAFLIILVVVIMIGYIVYFTIIRPLRYLVKMTKSISGGNINACLDIKGNDEICLVAESMNRMLDNMALLIQEVQDQRNTLQGQIDNLVTEVRVIALGNLQAQPKAVSGILGGVALFFDGMIEELSGLIIRVKKASREVEASATMTLPMLAQLVHTSNVQLQEIAEATVEIGQMVNSSRQVAERTHMLSAAVHDAQSAIENERLSVKQAIDDMRHIHENVHEMSLKVQEIDERSRSIKDIFALIANVAQQMKFLAYDAAKQASLVGDNGKGFAVVAGDIQRLADRTAGEISSVGQIVQSVHGDIASATLSMQDTERESLLGAKLAWEAGVSLETIFATVEHQEREMDTINQMITQQLRSFNTIENIMHLISQSTLQMTENTGNASQSLYYLARQIEELCNSVEAFKLRQTSPLLRTTLNVDPVTPLPSGILRRPAHFRSITPLPDTDIG